MPTITFITNFVLSLCTQLRNEPAQQMSILNEIIFKYGQNLNHERKICSKGSFPGEPAFKMLRFVYDPYTPRCSKDFNIRNAR